jgi:hypothetical protein
MGDPASPGEIPTIVPYGTNVGGVRDDALLDTFKLINRHIMNRTQVIKGLSTKHKALFDLFYAEQVKASADFNDLINPITV